VYNKLFIELIVYIYKKNIISLKLLFSDFLNYETI